MLARAWRFESSRVHHYFPAIMIWHLYNILFVLGFLLLLPRFLYRMWRRGGYRAHFGERFARYNDRTRAVLADSRQPRIWIHAVSVGEIHVAFTLIDAWRKKRPELTFALSTTTSTAYKLGAQRLSPPDVLFYFPVDLPFIQRRALAAIRPRALVLVEAEWWPNVIREARKQSIPVALVNGRMSDSSFNGYRKLQWFMKQLLGDVQVLCAQSKTDAERLVALGAPAGRVHAVGSTKYEIAAPPENRVADIAAQMRDAGLDVASRTVWVGGSTWPGEEEALVDLYLLLKKSYPSLALTLVPRHAERAGEIVRLIEKRGLAYAQRSNKATVSSDPIDIYLADTTGELMFFYALADVVFVGKSLTQQGGQNVIEPAALGKPVVVGPHMGNFKSIMEDFLAAQALLQVPNKAQLEETMRKLLGDDGFKQTLGARATALVRAKSGAMERTISLLEEMMRT